MGAVQMLLPCTCLPFLLLLPASEQRWQYLRCKVLQPPMPPYSQIPQQLVKDRHIAGVDFHPDTGARDEVQAVHRAQRP